MVKPYTAIDRAINPPNTTLTECFEFCNRVKAFRTFARTLFYSEVSRYFTWVPTKNGFLASKAHRLMHAPVYSNETSWGEYLQ